MAPYRCLASSAARPVLAVLLPVALCLAAGLSPGPAGGAAPRYSLIEVVVGNNPWAADLNDSGQVTGTVNNQAFRTQPFQPFDPETDLLGLLPGGNASFGEGINNAGQVVGRARDASGRWQIFRTEANGPLTEESVLGEGNSPPRINEGGVVTGQSGGRAIRASGRITDADRLGTFWTTDDPRFPDGYYGSSYGTDINDSGQVCGVATLGNTPIGFRCAGPKLTEGDKLPAGFRPQAVNAAGLMCGYSSTLNTAALLSGPGAEPEMLDPPAGFRGGSAVDLNDAGRVVGSSVDAAGAERAVIWESGRAQDLNTLIPTGSGWTLLRGMAINGLGHILAWGSRTPGGFGFVLLVPSQGTDLRLRDMSVTPAKLKVGQETAVGIGVHNDGPALATNVTVTVPLPAGLVFLRSDPPATVTAGKLVFNLGALSAREARRPTFRLGASAAGTYLLKAEVKADAGDTNPGNNTVSGQVQFTPVLPDLLFSITDTPDPVDLGSPVLYDVLLANAGEAPASGVRLECTLPPASSVTVVLATRGSVNTQADRLTWTLGSLAADETEQLTLRVAPTRAGAMLFRARALLTEADANPANNTVEESTQVRGGPDLVPAVLDPFTLERRKQGKKRPWFLVGRVGVRNEGKVGSPNSRIEFWLSRDRLLSADDRAFSPTQGVPALPAKNGAVWPVKVKVRRDRKTKGSIHKGKFLIVVVDPQNRIQETNETNNQVVQVLP